MLPENDYSQSEQSGFDLIGDIHGYANELIQLLEKLGYQKLDGVFHHSVRRAIFLGDFIDRGPGQREVIDVVRPMIERGNALAVMGNHEFNAIAYSTETNGGEYLRPHSEKNRKQHSAFLDAYPDEEERSDVIAWFKTLPLWLDLGDLRVVHAVWCQDRINSVGKAYGATVSNELMHDASNPGHWAFNAVETLLKGQELELPPAVSFRDKDGIERRAIRSRWWTDAKTYREAFIGPSSVEAYIPDSALEPDSLIRYAEGLPPVFIGHYWLDPPAAVLSSNIACLDYSIARAGGQLTAYRWSGEKKLSSAKFCSVQRID